MSEVDLALQLRFSRVSYLRGCLMSSSPERPRDDVGGVDAPLRQPDNDASDFLNRPSDQRRRAVLIGRLMFFWASLCWRGVGWRPSWRRPA